MKLLFKIIPKLAKIFSGGKNFKFFVLIPILWYFVLSRKILKLKGDFILDIVFNNKQLRHYLRYPMDLAVLEEIYIAEEYKWCPVEHPKTIIDLGAHFGDTALYYHARFPEANIIAVEPSPENYERLVKHTQHITNIIALNAAVGSKNGVAKLNLVNSTLGHSIVRRENPVATLEVPQLSIGGLMNKYGLNEIDLLKFDIEGAEFGIFETLFNDTPIISMIGELHFDLVKDWDYDLVRKKLSGYEIDSTPLDQHGRYVIMATRNKKEIV